jgi:flagellar protein FliO/FliZ
MSKSNLLFRAVATATACLLACACPAAAFTPPSKTSGESTPLNLNTSTAGSHTSSGGASLTRTIVGLAIVIAVIWGLSWILRQVKASREGGGGPHSSTAGLASVAALTLSSGRSLHLVRAGSDYVLLGSAEHGVVPIHRYTEEQAREAGLLVADADSDGSRAVSRRQITAGHSGADPMRMSSPSSNLVERLREWTVRR